MKRHPGKHELMAYAESLVDKGATVSAAIGGHLAGCAACQAEAEVMRRSLAFVRQAPDLEPSSEFTARLLLAAQAERQAQQRRAARPVTLPLLKGLAYAAAVVLVSALCFGAALGVTSSKPDAQPLVAKHVADSGLSPEAILKAKAEIQTLAEAVNVPSRKPPSVWELERRRAVHALKDDIEAAQAALERNPGCLRASRVVDANLQRQAQALRALYLERSL
jgi:anti-sigma factor RsiW